MRYDRVTTGTFLSRPNRFIAKVEINGRMETVNVKNTGKYIHIVAAKRSYVVDYEVRSKFQVLDPE